MADPKSIPEEKLAAFYQAASFSLASAADNVERLAVPPASSPLRPSERFAAHAHKAVWHLRRASEEAWTEERLNLKIAESKSATR